MADSETDRKRKRTLTIEEYLDFCDSGGRLNLSYDKLTQIISAHGFQHLDKCPKKPKLREALRKLELKELTRSTRQDDADDVVSPNASFSLKEAVRGLRDLDWQECHVTSLLTLNNNDINDAVLSNMNNNNKKKKKQKKKKKKTVRKLMIQDSTSPSTIAAAGGTSGDDEVGYLGCSSSSGFAAEGFVFPRKKRSYRAAIRRRPSATSAANDIVRSYQCLLRKL